jgi:hypothetical protein
METRPDRAAAPHDDEQGARTSIADAQREMVTIVSRWLAGASSITAFESDYWTTRRRLLNEVPEAFTGVFGDSMSDIDVAVDAYSDDELVLGSIREPQMRDEVVAAMDRLRAEAPDLFQEPEPAG